MKKILNWVRDKISNHFMVIVFFTFCYVIVLAGSYYWATEVIKAGYTTALTRKMGYAKEGIDASVPDDLLINSIKAVQSGDFTPNFDLKSHLDIIDRVLGTGFAYVITTDDGPDVTVVADAFRLHIPEEGYIVGTKLSDQTLKDCFVKIRYYTNIARTDPRGTWYTTCWPIYDENDVKVIGAIVVDFSVVDENQSHPETGKILLYSFANTYLPVLLSVMLVSSAAFKRMRRKT